MNDITDEAEKMLDRLAAQTDVAALVEKLKYIAAILDANAAKFTVPDHIPAKAKTVREAAATLESQARELAEARARILELETVTEEKVGAAPGEHCVVQPWDGQGYAVIETRSSGINPSNGMIAD
jgi:hypothetical protein